MGIGETGVGEMGVGETGPNWLFFKHILRAMTNVG